MNTAPAITATDIVPASEAQGGYFGAAPHPRWSQPQLLEAIVEALK
ncbi:MAG: hypothetical protein JSS42_11520 [Proteobacteria bacterium]|nr:hypothetical protein [Pseudomonadota bacterium]